MARTKESQAGKRGPTGLTPRERTFVAAFVQTLAETNGKGNGKLAAERIGCPPKSASVRASNFLKMPHIKSAIEVHVDQMCTQYDITTQKILGELRNLAFNGMSKFARQTEGGDLYLDFSACTEEELDALTELTVEEYTEGRAENQRNVKKNRIKIDRVKALELLGKYKKMWTDKMSLENPDGTPMQAPILNINFVAAPPRKDG